jgi:hypothetical protein
MEAPVRRLTPRARLVLRTALILAWIIGVGGAAGSCLVLKYYQGPRPEKVTESHVPIASASVPSPASGSASATAPGSAIAVVPAIAPASSTTSAAPAPVDSTEAQVELAADLLERFRRTRLPLTVANLLLSLALVVGAARTLARRPFGQSWLRQVCAATALFALAEWAASRAERPFVEDRLLVHAITDEEVARVHAAVKILYGVKTLVLFAQLALFGGLFVALGRSSVVLELAPREPGRSIPPPGADDGDA